MSHSPLARSILITRSFAPPRDAPTVMSGDTNIERRTAEFLAGFRGLKKRRPSLVALVPTDPDYEEAVDKWDDDRLSLDDDDDDGDDDGDDDEGDDDDDDENDDLATIQRKIARLAAEEDANRKHINETKRRIEEMRRGEPASRKPRTPHEPKPTRVEADEADEANEVEDVSRPTHHESPMNRDRRTVNHRYPTNREQRTVSRQRPTNR